ncbi:3-phosphoshikimate 1-carboxyvinyltransferase [Beijerinckia indica]|uniref:3-phosphoshikimate 1-carboxyvinyltransferase n=1 Tax=Beijerinckia indica subsp. indica (strain ATCC 9039 / DSM 1715 / NCIMB 8712) TaxID=395963 RepID=B2IC06_BEII9|nr:3-phosphoshikimate 1-carboxyvinyltransferase [Beijerinckia indica]ACB95261.1 3-phosphoshikimate 1-carboxyvinyltransferase [Beijerinckia indica subsp. indica ATCC 9039]
MIPNHKVKDALRLSPPGQPLQGHIRPPGSKSITNRALLLAALAKGESRLTGALASDDTAYMAKALKAMGVGIESPDATTFHVKGTGHLHAPGETLFLGNAGTATRFLTAAAALADGRVVIDGDANMRKRPIAPLVTALQSLGVSIEAPTGCPPVTIDGRGRVAAGDVSIDAGLSSQYVSALLMLAPCGEGPIRIVLQGTGIGARGYVDLTLAAMHHFGAEVLQKDEVSWTLAPTGYRARDFVIEPDASAATYLWAAAVLTQGTIDLGVPASAFTQPDAKAYSLITSFPHMPAVIEGSQIQDAVPTLAVMAAFNKTPVRFTDIANLRVKECDRIHALATELARITPDLAREEGDDLIVTGDPALIGRRTDAIIETYDDHRIAMSFALAGLMMDGLTILDPDCVAKTYPGFWNDLGSLGVRLERIT